MKRKGFYSVLVAFLCLSLLFCGLWIGEKQEHDDLEQLCRYSAERACARFRSYRDDGMEYDYHYGVAELTGFYNAYMNLVTKDTGTTDVNCMNLNQLIGKLMYYPELSGEQAGELVSAMDLLSKDIHDANAYGKILGLYNELNRA